MFERGRTLSEKYLDSPQLRIESGIHPNTPKEGQALLKRALAGDFDIHGWNKEVGIRMRQYNPGIISIDGLTPAVYYDRVQQAINIWMCLPARPSQINKEGRVLVISGDPYWFGLSQQGIYTPNSEEGKKLQDDFLDKDLEQIYDLSLRRLKFHGGMLIPAIGTLAAGATLVARGLRNQDRKDDVSFGAGLIAAGVSTAAVDFLTFYATKFSSLASSEKSSKFWQQVMEKVSLGMEHQSWMNGRTAVMIAHQEYAMNHSNLPEETSGAVVVGNGHLFGSRRLLTDRNYRNHVILNYAQELMDTFAEAMKGSGRMSELQARNHVFNYLTSYSAHIVRDPSTENVSSEETVVEAITDAVTYYESKTNTDLYYLLLPLNPLISHQLA